MFCFRERSSPKSSLSPNKPWDLGVSRLGFGVSRFGVSGSGLGLRFSGLGLGFGV